MSADDLSTPVSRPRRNLPPLPMPRLPHASWVTTWQAPQATRPGLYLVPRHVELDGQVAA